jgi:hypothetical protein
LHERERRLPTDIMRTTFSTRRLVVIFAITAMPLAVVQIGLAWSVGPIARTGARALRAFANGLPRGDDAVNAEMAAERAPAEVDPRSGEDAPPVEEMSMLPVGRRRMPGLPPPSTGIGKIAERNLLARRARPSVFVGPDSIKRAIPAASRPTSTWTERTAQHPAGLLIQSPGALRGVIEPGDILVEAEGQTLGSFEQLITAVKQAYERREKRLSGRIYRRGDFVPVTVEPGW